MSPAWIHGAALAASALLGLGCAVPLEAPPVPGQVNACTSSATCGQGATCSQGLCVATEFDLSGLLLEVRPHSNATFGANTSYILDLADTNVQLLAHGPSDRPFRTQLDLPLPKAFSVVGGRVRVSHDTPLEPSCNLGPDRAIPAHLTFYPVPKFDNLPSDPIPAIAGPSGATFKFDADLVPGAYDVYVEPKAVAGCNKGNPYPPVFFPGQVIGASSAAPWTLPELPLVGHLTGTITGFGSAAPTAWKIELLEPGRGLPISANGALTPTNGGFTIAADIAWQDKAPPILRLRPVTKPSDPPRPTAYWALVGSLFGGSQTNPVVSFAVDHLYEKPIQVSGQVQGTDEFTGVAASITIQSLKLPGTDAENAALSVQSLDTGPQGNFGILLPPGSRYRFRAFPVDNGLSVTDEDHTVLDLMAPPTMPDLTPCDCGLTLSLTRKLNLAGAVKTPTGERLADAAVNITPAQTLSSSYWQNTHALAAPSARPTATTTDTAGTFTLLVDSGSSDLTIQAGAGSNFPWLVRPQLGVLLDTELSSLTLTSPAILSGTVTDPGGMPVADAEVNAWFPVRDPKMPGGLTGVVVKIATTATDANGGYTLILPSSI